MSDADGDVVMGDAKKEVKEAQVDEALYSRQLYVFGHEAQKRMAETNVLLVGLRGLGVEIAKNIILAGVKSVGLLDQGLVTVSDLSAQFYLDEKCVGKNRAASCFEQLVGLNKYVRVHLVKDDIKRAIESKAFQVVVVTDIPIPEQIALDEACRALGVKFIAADIRGLFGSTFVDLGSNHVISDKDGEELKRGLVVSVSQANPGIVTVHEDRRHGLETGDLVTFEEIEGMVELNNSAPRPIKVIGPHSFSIEDTTGYHAYTGSRGYFQQVKQTVTVSFKSLKEAIAKPTLIGDVSFTGNQLHCLYSALSTFQGKHGGKLPNPTSLAEAKEVVDLTKGVHSTVFGKPDVDEKLLIKLARCSSAQLSPMAALMGGIVGQEVLKACTGKFTPISEFLYYDASKCLPDVELDMKEYAPLNSRYDAQIAVFGRSLHEKIMNLRYFLVGAGAIGCEMLKNWALMGLACGPKGQVFITDMDTIEKSNLNRQFLFREHDVSQLKSQIAAREGKRMNPDLKVTAQSLRVGAQSEDVYDDKFWEGLNGVCTALDNVDARLYVDSRCVYYQKPLVDSGTLGTKGNTQVVVPFLTESYGSSRDPPEESIPICTLKNFPNKIEHTIQWARDLFEGYFKQAAEEVNNYLSSPDYFEENAKSPNTQLSNLQTVLDSLVTSRPSTFDDCIRWGRFKFQEEFSNKIRQLLTVFPADSKDSAGTPFWSGPKRPPEPITFDVKDSLHLEFVIAAANLRAFNYGLEGSTDPAVFRRVLDATVVPVFVPSAQMKIAKNDEEAKAMAGQLEDDHDRKVAEVAAAIPARDSLGGYRLRPTEFEKDDDKNFHMDFITACSNLRARNYRIKEESKHQTKFIAGKIIPAIATTTALVTGLVCLEIYKLVQGKPVDAFQNTYVNLAIPLLSASEPMPPARKEAKLLDRGEWKWSLWDRIDIDIGDCTLKEFLDHFRERFGLEATMISYGSSMLYYQFGAAKKNVKERLKLPMSRVVEKVAKVNLAKDNYLVLEIVAADPESSADVDIPYIRLKIK